MSSHPCLESVVHVLHMCRLERNQACTLYAHSCICSWGLDSSPWLGNNIVSVLAEAGSAGIAWNVFLKLTHRTIYSWNSLMTGFVKLGDPNHTLHLYKRLKDDRLHPNEHTYVAALKACTELNSANEGCVIHAEILMMNCLAENLYINSILIHMYATCGLLASAQKLFEKISSKSIVVWNALIAGYTKHERANEALVCYETMQHAGVTPNAITYVCVLKAYGSTKVLEKGKDIHVEIARSNLLDSNSIIQCALVDMYAKCGSLITAQEVFDKLSTRCLFTWTALVSGYVNYAYGREALNCFEQMRLEGIYPNSVSFASGLKACGIIGALDKGTEIHAEVSQNGLLNNDRLIGNALIDMYIECGVLTDAEEVFDELPFRDVVSWNTLMAGYSKFERHEDALDLLDQMIEEDHCPDAVTYIFALKSCGITGAKDRAFEIHTEVARKNILERETEVGNTMVDVYSKLGSLQAAQEVFGSMCFRDVVSWTALISGFANKGLSSDALKYYRQMQVEGVHPNVITVICVLQACGRSEDQNKGESIHVHIVGNEMLERDPSVCSALIDMYANCGSIVKAREVFEKSPAPNQVVWNTMLAGYANHDHCEEALEFFNMMALHGLSPDKITYLSCLKACGRAKAAELGRELHAGIATNGLLETEAAIGSAIIHMYAECGLLFEAHTALSNLIDKDTAAWTALMAGYVKHDDARSALRCFEEIQVDGTSPNAVTYIFGLKACASVGAVEKGQEIFSEIAREGLLKRDHKIRTSLIDMYVKSGHLAKAQEVFDTGSSGSIASWNALISSYASRHEAINVLACFEEMQLSGFSPDNITFLNVLGVCKKAGLVENGYTYFRSMNQDHGIDPTQLHQRCMVDLLARTGNLGMANEVLRRGVFRNPVVCRSMLNAIHNSGYLDTAKAVSEYDIDFGSKQFFFR